MIIARLTSGMYIVGITERNIELLKEDKPMVVRLSLINPSMSDMCVIYGKTMKEIEAQIEDKITPDTLIIDKR